MKKPIMNYHCRFCNNYFEQSVGKSSNGGKHKKVSSQVQCPKCKNFVKTW